MLRSLSAARGERAWVFDVIGILAFTAITALSARIQIPLEPVAFTMQPLAVLLSGLVLGARGGFLSQLLYVGLIALGAPIDANMRGAAALVGPTAGYLIGFVAAAFVTGFIYERGKSALWAFIAGLAGVLVIYAFGVPVLKFVANMEWGAAIASGVGFFIVWDIVKAAIAAALVTGGRMLLKR
jgi:biotin transport system substrate-specific component